jgi:hypothetical protein
MMKLTTANIHVFLYSYILINHPVSTGFASASSRREDHSEEDLNRSVIKIMRLEIVTETPRTCLYD